MRINLGCGRKKLEGYLNIDSNKKAKPDLIWDISKGLPFKDNTVEEINASHILEHLGDSFFTVMDEAYRVLKDGGRFNITVPFYKSESAWGNPYHKRAFSDKAFLLYARTGFREDNDVDSELPCFSSIKVRLAGGVFTSIYYLVPLQVWRNFFGFLIDEIRVEMVK